MTFDNLTLAGLLLTLPYIVLLVAFGKHRDTSKKTSMFVFNDTVNENYSYGAGRNARVQSEHDLFNSCV